MEKNIHGFEPKQEFTMGGIAWTVIQTGAEVVDMVKHIAAEWDIRPGEVFGKG